MLVARDGNSSTCPTSTQFHPDVDPPGSYNFSQCATTVASNTSDVLQKCCNTDVAVLAWPREDFDSCWAYCNYTSGGLSDDEYAARWSALYDCYDEGVKAKFGNQTHDLGIGAQCVGSKQAEGSDAAGRHRVGSACWMVMALVIMIASGTL